MGWKPWYVPRPASPILMISLTRPGLYKRRPGWGEDWPGHTRLELAPLSAQGKTTALASLTLRAAMGYDSKQRPTGALSTMPSSLMDRGGRNRPRQPLLHWKKLVHNYFDEGVLVQIPEKKGWGSWQVDLTAPYYRLPARQPAGGIPGSPGQPAGAGKESTKC